MSRRSSSTDPVAVQLGSVVLFSTLEPKELVAVRHSGQEHTVAAGEVLVREGDLDARLFVILSGTATAQASGHDPVPLGPGDHFGEISVFDGQPRTATVTADTDMHLFSLANFNMRVLVREQPDIALGLLKGLCAIIRR
jgi:CRP-like cAMP-binding protein